MREIVKRETIAVRVGGGEEAMLGCRVGSTGESMLVAAAGDGREEGGDRRSLYRLAQRRARRPEWSGYAGGAWRAWSGRQRAGCRLRVPPASQRERSPLTEWL